MGKVFLAVDREADQSNPFVALKMLGDSFRQHPQSLKALRREAMQSRRLNHPNIVNVYDFDRTDGHVFMVMEYMQGLSLEDHLQRNPGTRKLTEVWHIVEACGRGLHYLHEQHIVHSDFKPSNVFLTEEGEVKVLDLGIARTVDETRVAGGTTRFDPDALGAMTPRYASCEMFEGLTPTPHDDLFALGCVVYELLTGSHPYEGGPADGAGGHRPLALEARAARKTPKRPRGLRGRRWKALSSALAFSRTGRPPSVQHFLEELAPTRRKSSPLPWIGTTILVLVVAVAVAVNLLRSPDERFIEALLEQYAEAPDTPMVPAQVDDYLNQGDFFVRQSQRAVQLGDYDRVAAMLLTSPSSAYQAYRLVLTKSDSSEAKARAADGMLQISRVFRDAASAMRAANEDPMITARTVCNGLQVNRFDAELDGYLRALNDEIPTGISSVTACRELVGSGRVSIL